MGLCVNIASFFYTDKQLENVEDIDIFVKIVSVTEEMEYRNKYIVKVLKSNYVNDIENIKLIIYTEKNEIFLPGDILKVKGIFTKAVSKRNFGGFDYDKYLKQFKIFGIIQVEECQKVAEEKDVMCYLENVRMNFLNKIDTLYNNECSGFLKSLLFGKSDELSEEIKENFRDSSISHVLAISGMHVSYVIISLRKILDKLIKNKKIKNYILIFCLIMFSILTGNSVSCIRACIMSGMICLASNFEKKNNFYFSFIYSFLIIIIYNPYNIYNIGLWLSYMGTLGIVILSSFLKRYICYKLKMKIDKNSVIFLFINNILENLIVTISAQILIFPITMYVFNTISIFFFISNILISFFVGPTLILGYISVFFSYIKIPIFKILVFVEERLIGLILCVSKICAELPFSKIYVTTPSFISVMSYYFVIVFIIYKFYTKRFYMIRVLISNDFIKKEIIRLTNNWGKRIINFLKFKPIYIKRMIISIILLIILIFYFEIKNKKELQINFVDVGQGDCTYIKTPKGKNIIIDGGEGNTEKYDYGKNVVLPYLLDKKVNKIDYLIATHADSDHIGGLFAVIENIKVDKIIIGIQPESSEQYLELLRISEKKNINVIELAAGAKVKIEKNISLEVLWPIENKLIEENALNNNSLVFKISYNNFSSLFTGDIEEIAEKKIVEEYENCNILKSNMLKVAHHGSKTSSIELFLEKVTPQIALIGVGQDNNFGHPNEVVLERLEKLRARSFRTDQNGEINIFVNNNGKIRIKKLY